MKDYEKQEISAERGAGAATLEKLWSALREPGPVCGNMVPSQGLDSAKTLELK